jgi:predicted transcriptional regulator
LGYDYGVKRGKQIQQKPKRETLAEYHIRMIEEGIRDADAGRLIDDKDLEKAVNKLRRRK